VLVLTAWTVAFVVDLLSPTYQPPPELTPLVLGVSGALLGGPVIREWKDRDR
jgi:hypothetical protein